MLLNFIVDCMNYRISPCVVVQDNASSTVIEYEDNEISLPCKKENNLIFLLLTTEKQS